MLPTTSPDPFFSLSAYVYPGFAPTCISPHAIFHLCQKIKYSCSFQARLIPIVHFLAPYKKHTCSICEFDSKPDVPDLPDRSSSR